MEMAGYERSLLKTTSKIWLQFFGHIYKADMMD